MNEKQSQSVEVQAQIIDGKIVIPMIGGPAREISIEKLQDLLEFDVAKSCNDTILNIGQVACQMIANDIPDLKMYREYFSEPNDLYVLRLVAEAFRK